MPITLGFIVFIDLLLSVRRTEVEYIRQVNSKHNYLFISSRLFASHLVVNNNYTPFSIIFIFNSPNLVAIYIASWQIKDEYFRKNRSYCIRGGSFRTCQQAKLTSATVCPWSQLTQQRLQSTRLCCGFGLKKAFNTLNEEILSGCRDMFNFAPIFDIIAKRKLSISLKYSACKCNRQ